MVTCIRTRRPALLAAVSRVSVAFLLSVALASAAAALEPTDDLAMGAKLFSDARLSADGTISCATCHDPAKAFSDGKPVAIGLGGQFGVRNTPSLLTAALQTSFFWDGRRTSLESQVLDPLVNSREHGFASFEDAIRAVERAGDYPQEFTRKIDIQRLAHSLALYVRSLGKGRSRFDRYWSDGNKRALSAEETTGFEVFRGVGGCANCHLLNGATAAFTDNDFHSLGFRQAKMPLQLAEAAMKSANASAEEVERLVTSDASVAALGRFNVTRKPTDIGKYRTPSLRNVALTAPYMHDGSISSLEEAVDLEIYYRGTQLGRPLILTPRERKGLLAFLRALTNESLERPEGNQ